MKLRYCALAAAVALVATGCGKKEEAAKPSAVTAAAPAAAADAAAKKWIDSEFQPSTLGKDAQAAELKWLDRKSVV